MKTAIHNKSGREYIILMEHIINATNENDGQEMVIYQNMEKDVFVREKKEFFQKFTVKNPGALTANQILKASLIKSGYEGLYFDGGCGCDLKNLNCCGEYPGDCLPGWKHPARTEDEDYFISAERKH